MRSRSERVGYGAVGTVSGLFVVELSVPLNSFFFHEERALSEQGYPACD